MAEIPVILTVEDDPATQFILKNTLEATGLKVIGEADGREALSSIIRYRPDMVILDLNLPTVNGDKVLRVIRNNPSYPWMRKLPVVVLTSNKNPKVIREIAALECSGYLIKPLNIQKLHNICDSVLDGVLPSGRKRQQSKSKAVYKHIYCMSNPDFKDLFLSMLADQLMLFSHIKNIPQEEEPIEEDLNQAEDSEVEHTVEGENPFIEEMSHDTEPLPKHDENENAEEPDDDESQWEKVPSKLISKSTIISGLESKLNMDEIYQELKLKLDSRSRPGPKEVSEECSKLVHSTMQELLKVDITDELIQ